MIRILGDEILWKQSLFHGGKDRKLSRIAYPRNLHFDPEHTTPGRFSKEVHPVEEHPAVGSQE